MPYLIAAFQRYSTDGAPPFRALVLDAPNDKRLYSVDDQYMIGDRMMVAPLFAGEPSRKVVLPEGGWHDFWSGAPMSSGTELTVPASTDRIPIYVKTGSIIPWADVGQCASTAETRRITARVYGDGSIPFALDADKTKLRLSWSHGHGSEDGTIDYVVHTWQEFA
ncbi:MAG: hypothetical protein WBE56_02935 [Terracidiphilus sp.]